MRKGYREEERVELGPEQEAALVQKLTEFSQQPTLGGREAINKEDEMISVSRLVRKKRGSWWQLPKDCKEAS